MCSPEMQSGENRAGVGDGHDSDNDSIDDACNVRVLGAFVYISGDER